MKTENEGDPLESVNETLSAAEQKAVERSMALKRQASKMLELSELMDDIKAVLAVAEARRDETYGDEHFQWAGQAIAIKGLLRRIDQIAEYQPAKGGKRANSYV